MYDFPMISTSSDW